VAPDGTEYPCDVLRDGDNADGLEVWIAVPRGPLPPIADGWSLRADMLPGRASLRVEVPLD
jgi:hypothetical protein